MTNEMKLLRAFIEASGFEVEEVKAAGTPYGSLGTSPAGNELIFDGESWCDAVIDYKVTKKDAYVPLLIQSEAWGCIVEYLSDHEDDIEIGVNDFATLRPIWEFITRDRT